MFLIYTFYISLAAILLMLGFKFLHEYHLEEVAWWENMISKADKRIHGWLALAQAKIRLWKKIALLFIFEFLPHYAETQIARFKEYVYKKYYQSADTLRAERRELSGNGNVSEFLQNITKEEGKNIKIEK